MKASLPYKYITSVKNGKYYVVFDYKDASNKRKRKWVTTGLPEKCSKKALKAKVDEIAHDFEENFINGNGGNTKLAVLMNVDTDENDMELEVFFQQWLAATKTDLARTTHSLYTRNVSLFMSFINKNYPHLTLKQITHTHVQEYLNYKITQGRKGQTCRQYYLVLHSAFAYAVKMEMLAVHPMDKVKTPRADKHEATFYNNEELQELFKVFEGDRLELVVHIAAYYGLRRCEVIGLKWEAIDFKNKTITIQRKVVSDHDENGKVKLYVETRLKTKSTRRTLPLIPHIEEMLLEKKKSESYYNKACGKNYDTEFEGFICRDEFGHMISPEYVTLHFHHVVMENGLRHLRFHDLRHSCASLLLANDIPMKAIQEWLGHSNFNITIPVPNSNTKPIAVRTDKALSIVKATIESALYFFVKIISLRSDEYKCNDVKLLFPNQKVRLIFVTNNKTAFYYLNLLCNKKH